MSKEVVKAIFDENIAGVREDLTFDAYFDSIKGNEEYKKGLFENYVNDGTKSYEEFNAETFGVGKPGAPSEVGGAESSPTGLGLNESEVGPPAGGTPPGAEPVGAPVSDAIEPIEPGEPEAPAITVGLEEFSVIDNKKDKGFLETIFGWLGGEKTFERVEKPFEELVPARQRLFKKAAAKDLSKEIGSVFTEAESDENIAELGAKGFLSTNNLAGYLAGDFKEDNVAREEINKFLEEGVSGQTEAFKRFKGNIDPIIAEQSNEIKETMLKDRAYINLNKEIDREFASQRAKIDAKYKGVINAKEQAKLKEDTVGLLAEYDAVMLSLPTENDVLAKENEMFTKYQLLVNDGKMDVDAANAELEKEYDSYIEDINAKATEAKNAYNSGLEKAAEKIKSGLKDTEEYKQYISELTELRNGIITSREGDLKAIQARIQGDLAPKYNERINSVIRASSSGPTPLLEKSGLLPTIQKVINNKGFDLLPFDQKKAFLDRAFGNVVVQLRSKGVAINDGTIARLRNEYDDAIMSKAYFTQKGAPSLYMLKTRAIEEAEKLDEVIASTKAKTGTKTFTSGVYASEFGQQGKGYDDRDLDQLLLAREKLQEIIDLPENMTDNEFANFWNGLTSGQFVDYLPFVSGLKNLAGSLTLYRSLDDDTPASRYLQNAVALGNSYKGVYEVNNMASDWYKAGAATVESIPFMGEFVFTAGMSSVARKSTEKFLIKLFGGATEKTVAGKGMRVLAGTLVGALAQTTANPQRYIDETIKRMTPQMSMIFSEEGDDLIAMLDESTAEGGFEAFLKGYGVTASEYFSENLGFAGARVMKYAGSRMMQNEFLKRLVVGYYMSKLNIDMPTAVKRLAGAAGYNGLPIELVEEIFNMPLTNLITGDADVMAGILTESGDLDIENLMEVGRALVPISAAGVGANVMGIAVKSMTPEKVILSFKNEENKTLSIELKKSVWDKVSEAAKSPSTIRDFATNELPKMKLEGVEQKVVSSYLNEALQNFERGVVESTKPPQAKGVAETQPAETQPAPKVSVQMKERKKLSADKKRLVGTGKFDFVVTIDGKEQNISRAEYNEYKRSGKLPEGIGADVLGEVDRVEGVVVESTKDAESIKTSLEGVEVPAELGTIENVAEVYEQAKGKEELTDEEVAVVDFVEGNVAKVEGVSEGAVEATPEAETAVSPLQDVESTTKALEGVEQENPKLANAVYEAARFSNDLPLPINKEIEFLLHTEKLKINLQDITLEEEGNVDLNSKDKWNTFAITAKGKKLGYIQVKYKDDNTVKIGLSALYEGKEEVKQSIISKILDLINNLFKTKKVEISDKKINVNAGKGVGKIAYELLAVKLKREYQKDLVSDTTRSDYAENLWKSFEKQGKASVIGKTDTQYRWDYYYKFNVDNQITPQQAAEAYHKAKADNSNPELVKAVEDLLGVTPEAVTPEVSGVAEVAEGINEEQKVEEISTATGIKPKSIRDLYKVNRELFGQSKIKAFASAIAMDRMVGAMAKRAGISKKEMYGKLEFRKATEKDLPQGVKMQVDAWHGSPYRFDKFTTQAIGTGEGAQAFGWGLYFTDLKSIARNYADTLSRDKKSIYEENLFINEGEEFLRHAYFNDLKNASLSQVKESYYDRYPIQKPLSEKEEREIYEEEYDNLISRRKLQDDIYNKRKDEVAKELEKLDRNLYKVSLHKGKTPDQYTWLEWDKPLNKQRANELISKLTERQREQAFGYGISGIQTEGEFYKKLANALGGNLRGGDKNASLFLLENGIDGIKYPAESISRGVTSDTARGFNYVVFDENAVSIEEVIKFQRDAVKARGAMMMTMDGKAVIYALTDPNVSTPLHELAHVFEHYLTPSERNAVIRAAGTKEWNTETSEFFARGFEKYLADGVSPIPELAKLFQKFQDWLTEIYKGIVDSGIDITLNDDMRRIYSEMLGEVSGVAEVAETQPSAETPAKPLTLKEKAKEAKQKANEALKEFDRLTEERRNTGEGISPFGRAERLADLDKKRLKQIIDFLKFAAQSEAYSFADFISNLLERGIVVDYNSPEDRAFYEKHSGKKISEEQPKSIGITNAYDEAAREARGADPIAKKASTTNKQVWDEAMEITKQKDVPAQIAVWAAQDGFVEASPINQALILYDRIRIENEREILLKQIGGASDSKLVSIYERLAALEVETDLNETANKNMGRTWGVTGAFRQALADRAYTITGVIARAKAVGGKNVSAADEVRLTNMAKEIELLQKQKAELEKKLSEELAKERVAAENKVMNEARRKPLPGTTTIEDVKSAYQKWLESKKATGIMFDPKSSAKADIEFLEVVLDYLKSQAINTVSKVKKAVKDFTDGGLEVDDEGAAFILEELKARSEAEKPKKPAAKKKPTTPKEPSKKIEEKSIDELLADISEKAEGQIDETNISSLRPYFAEVIRKEVANGAETLDQIVDKIYDKLLETIPSLTKADLKDAMSGYGQFRELSKLPLEVKIREVKRIGRLEAALRDVEEKLKLPKRTGVEQDQLSVKARALRQQILKAISDLGITPELTDEELAAKWQSARDAYKRRLDNAIADVELEIANKEKKAKKQPTEFNDQEIADLRASLKALREVRDNIPEIKANEADRKLSAKIEATKKKIAEAERKIAEGDLSVKETEKLTSPELDALREELKGLNEQLSKMREDAKPEAQQISEAQARLDGAARREIARLEALRNKVLAEGIGAEEVNAGEIATIKKKKKFPNLKRADALQTQIDNLRRAISDLIPEDVKQEALVQKYLASREKILERLTEKYNNKDYETKKRPVPPASKEIAAVNRKINEKKKEIEADLERIRLRNRSMIEKLGGGIIDLAALAKSLIASVDLSAPLRQGIVYAVTEPKIFAKVFGDMFKFAFSEKNYQNWLNEVKEDPRFDEYTSRYKLHISDQTGKMSAREEQFMSKFFGAFKKIPVYGQLLTGSERAYAGFINKLRWDVFQKYVEEVESMGLTKEEADVELKALAKFVNTATGRGELGVLSSAAVPLNSLLFSPRLVSSRLHPFMMPFLYSKMPKLARQKAAKTYAMFFGSIITTMFLLSFLMDDDKDEGIELDPRSSDFLKIRFQDYRVDPFGGYQQAIVAIAKLLGGVKSTRTGEVKNFSDEGFGQQTREDIIQNYFTNKLAPVPSTIYRNYINPSPMDEANNLYSVLFGEVPKDQRSAMRKIGETVFDLTVPLYADDLIGVLSDDDVDLKTSVLAGSTIFGVGGGKYGGKTILRPGSKEFRVMKDITIAQPRFDTEVKIPEYDVDVKGKKIIQLTDEEGKEKKKFLTASQTKDYNEILRKTYTSFVSKMDVDLRESLSETEKKDFADFLLKKAKKIADLQYIANNNSSIKKIVEKRISNSEKAIIEKISKDRDMPYETLKKKINKELKITFPEIFEDKKENE